MSSGGIYSRARSAGAAVLAGGRQGRTATARIRVMADLLMLPVLKRAPVTARGPTRTVDIRGGVSLTYRREPGDLQTLREVWLDEIYRPPLDLPVTVAIDCGAHIGMTSVWLARRWGCRQIVAVEPSAENAALLRRNLAANDVAATVIEAGVGAEDGTGHFEAGSHSNLGKLTPGSPNVDIVSMATVLEELPAGTSVDLVKLDIEGGERSIFDADLGWCAGVGAIVLEAHRRLGGVDWLAERLRPHGFRRVDPALVADPKLAWFVREIDEQGR